MGWALNPMAGALLRREEDTEAPREGSLGKVKVEVSTVQPRAGDGLWQPATAGNWERGLGQARGLRQGHPARTCIRTSGPQKWKTVSVCFQASLW